MHRMKWLMEQHSENNGGGGGAPDWRAALPEAIRNDPSLSSFKDVGALAQSFIETKGLVGRSIRPPGPDAAPEAKKEFVNRLLQLEPALVYAPENDPESVNRLWKRLGKPEKVEEYELPEAVKEAGIEAKDLVALAVTAGLTKNQLKQIAETMAKATLEQKRLSALDRVALEQEWGAAKEERTLAAKAAALKMGLSEADVAAMTPKQMRAFANVAKAIGVNNNEFRRQVDGTTPADGPLDPAEAKRQMNDIRADPDFFDAYRNPGRHNDLVAKMRKLSAMAYR